MPSAEVKILVVEDSPEDYEAIERAFQKVGLDNRLMHCSTGDDALDYLNRRGRYAAVEVVRPGLVLLDLNLPGTDGREVLSRIKGDEDLKTVPVIVFTTSADERDIETCYRSGANSYIQKSASSRQFLESIQRLKDFWLETALLPGRVE